LRAQINKFQVPESKRSLKECFEKFFPESIYLTSGEYSDFREFSYDMKRIYHMEGRNLYNPRIDFRSFREGFAALEEYLEEQGILVEAVEKLLKKSDLIHQRSNGFLLAYVAGKLDAFKNRDEIFEELSPILGKIFECHDSVMRPIFIDALMQELDRDEGLKYYNELVGINPSFPGKELLAIILLKVPRPLNKNLFKLDLRKKVFQNSKNVMLLLNSYHTVLNSEELTDDEKSVQLDMIQKLVNAREEQKKSVHKYNKLKLRSMFLSLQGIAKLDPEKLKELTLDNIEDIYTKVFNERIPIGEVENFVQKYEETFGQERSSEALLAYAGQLSQLAERDQVLKKLGSFVKLFLEGRDSLHKERYKTEENPHLERVFKNRVELEKLWKAGDEYSLGGELVSSKSSIDIKDFLETKILIDGHLDHEKYPLLVHYLQGDDQALKKLEAAVNTSETPVKEKMTAGLQLKCIRLIKDEKLAEGLARDLKKQDPHAEFLNDLKWLQRNLQVTGQDQKLQEGYQVVDTDDPWDLFLSGTEVDGSCQRIDGDPKVTKSLLAYVLDGKNRMLAVKRPDGRIEARAIFRLLYDTKNDKPVLFMERVYSNSVGRFDKALLEMAIKRAKALGLTLLGSRGPKEYTGKIKALGSSMPYEYADSAGGVMSGGWFEIKRACVLSE